MCYSRFLGRGLFLVLVAFLFLPVSSVLAETIVIDDFDAPDDPVVAAPGMPGGVNPTLVHTVDGGILGGQRDVILTVVDTPTPASFIGEIGGGSFLFNSSVPGTIARLQYGAAGDVASTSSTFDLWLQFVDGGNFQATGIEVDVHSSTGGLATFAGTIPDNAGPSIYQIYFGDFDGDVLGVFGDVDSIEFRFNPAGNNNVDFALNNIQIDGEPIPEPSTLAMLAAGLVGLLIYARRRLK